jgi:hypothetical protein
MDQQTLQGWQALPLLGGPGHLALQILRALLLLLQPRQQVLEQSPVR